MTGIGANGTRRDATTDGEELWNVRSPASGTSWLNVTEPSAIAEARRHALFAADAIGLASPDRDRAAIVATEMATNLLRHARGGRITVLLDLHSAPGADCVGRGFSVVAVDVGPGIADFDRVERDGVSTAGSSGTGLGAIRRQSDGLDVHTGPDGTTLSARIARRRGAMSWPAWDVAALSDRYPGSEVCGDGFAMRRDEASWTVMVCDGLGHGRGAREATAAATDAFVAARNETPSRSLFAMSEAAKKTRGAVAMVARLPDEGAAITVAGIGNVAGLVVSGDTVRRLPARDGRLGGAMPRLLDQEGRLARGEMLILHSDGLRTLRDLEARRGLLARSSLTVAAALLRDDARGTDDACVLVARRLSGEG
jgi:anti-sigma regulatory factor (Ser/Thr protein kinase)